MNIQPEKLGNSILGKILAVLTNGQGAANPSQNSAYVWATPGIPVTPEDFDFMETMMGQGVETLEREQDANRRIQAAENFARLVDFIPDTSGLIDGEQLSVFNARVGTLSGEYNRMLRFSKVAKAELSDQEKERLERFEKLLTQVKVEEDLFTGAKIETLDDSQLVKRYKKGLADYEAAALEFNSLRINALRGDIPGAANAFSINGPILRNKVQAAFDAWVATGYKNQLEQISAYIAHVTQRDMTLVKRELEERMKRAVLNNPSSGNQFHYTSLVPANFSDSTGWTKFEFKEDSYRSYQNTETSSWGAAGGLAIGGFRLGGSGGGSSREYTGEIDMSGFHLSFELAQFPISRGWMAPEFMESHGWKFTNGQDMLSNGKRPPKGSLPAYPTMLVMARNIKLDMKELHIDSSAVSKTWKAGGYVGFGPFHLGGSYKRGSETREFERDSSYQGIHAPGMQIIGFKSHLLPLSPNPSGDVEEWV